MYVFGGEGSNRLNELHCLDLSTKTWIKIHGNENQGSHMPSKRGNHAMTINSLTGCIYVHGGIDRYNDLFKFTISTN